MQTARQTYTAASRTIRTTGNIDSVWGAEFAGTPTAARKAAVSVYLGRCHGDHTMPLADRLFNRKTFKALGLIR